MESKSFADSIKQSLFSELDSRDQRIKTLEAQLAAAQNPQPVPVPPTPVPPANGTYEIVPKNMVLGADSIYRSSGDPLNCYVQFRTKSAMRYAKIVARRRTNVLPDLSGGKMSQMNLKIVRDDRNHQGAKPNTYIAIGVGQGAWKLTTELPEGNPFNDGQWPSLPYAKDKWTDETWEFDYASGKFNHKVGNVSWAGSFQSGGVTRTDIGVQCVVAGGQQGGVPSNPYTEFQIVSFEWR